MRVYAIGDVHGRADLLDDLLGQIDRDRAKAGPDLRCFEIFLGDYVDRGPRSREVIACLLDRTATHGSLALCGNHELLIAKAFREPQVASEWLALGGLETVLSYGIVPPARPTPAQAAELTGQLAAAMPAEHLAFLSGRPGSVRIGDYFFAHAGVRPGVPLDQQSLDDLTGIRADFLASRRDHGAVIVHGHNPTARPEILNNRINVDTGAYVTGRLTCLVLTGDERRFLQTDA